MTTHDNKPFAITLDPGSSLENKTGTWRTSRPVYVNRLPPCNNACPAGENIQKWLYHAEEGDYEGAWRVLVEDNPMPAIHGRVCYRPCEDACNRAQLDEAVGIHAVERFLGDKAIEEGWSYDVPAETSGKRVLVVGAGPSGLSAAYHLRRLGHDVTIAEAGPMVGGMMRFGIPQYRLDRSVLTAEIDRLLATGIELWLEHKVEDIPGEMAWGGFDAVFLAIGAQLSRRTEIPADDAGKILDALSFLRETNTGEPPQLGRRVAVYGGGNTAMDAARTARRLGAEPIIVYRRDREHMPAHEVEAEEAEQEDVKIHWLRTIKDIEDDRVTVERMALDENGRPQPTGEYETLHADSFILALGQQVDTSFLQGVPGVTVRRDGTIEVDDNMMTGYPGLFAGGDMVPAERTVTVGVGHGKRAARCIDAYLRGEQYAPPPKNEIATFDKLNTWYYTDAPATEQPALDHARRIGTFTEVVGGLDETNALFEARRCLSCGNCFECDNCYGMCPDNAIRKLGPGQGYMIDYDYCKGCGICVEECPCGAVQLVPESV